MYTYCSFCCKGKLCLGFALKGKVLLETIIFLILQYTVSFKNHLPVIFFTSFWTLLGLKANPPSPTLFWYYFGIIVVIFWYYFGIILVLSAHTVQMLFTDSLMKHPTKSKPQNYRWQNGKVKFHIRLHLKVALPHWRMY